MLADIIDAAGRQLPDSVGINTMWVVVAGVLVMFMQAGFAFLEIGFSRGKNAGTVVAKILTNFSIAAIVYWAVRLRLRVRRRLGHVIGTHGFFLRDYGDPPTAFPIMGFSDATIESKFFFQFVFCAVSLAIVWGTTLERIKFGVYILYAVVFSRGDLPDRSRLGLRRRLAAGQRRHAGLRRLDGGPPDRRDRRAGGGAAPRAAARQVHGRGQPRAIPGHNMPLFGLGVLILWLGWFGFNPGSTLNALDGRFAEIVLVTNLAAAAGVLAALATAYWKTKTIDIGMAGNGAIAALVGDHRRSGYVKPWAALDRSALVAGVIVVLGVYAIDKSIDDPVGALSRPRPGRHLGHARVRPVHRIPTWRSSTPSARAASSTRAASPARPPGARRRGRVRVRLRRSLGHLLGRSRRPTACASRRRRRTPAWTSPSTACTAIPEQFIPAPELVGYGGGPYRTVPPAAVATRLGGAGMKMVMAYIRHEAFEPIRTELLDLGFPSLTITEVKGSGRQKGVTERYRGAELTNYLRPKIKLECVVADGDVQTIVDTILKHAPHRRRRRRQGVRPAGRGGLPRPHRRVRRGGPAGPPRRGGGCLT